MSNLNKKILVPIADSAGFAHDQIGAAFFLYNDIYADANEPKPSLIFHADQRFELMILDAATARGISADIASYPRGSFPINPEGKQKQNEIAQRLAAEKGATVVFPEDITQELAKRGYNSVNSPVGQLPARPASWFSPAPDSTLAVRRLVNKAMTLARDQAGVSSQAPVNFLFFFGGKSLTDSEENPDQKKLGGMVKSIGAEEQIPVIRQLQQAALAQGTVIIPVFAQYGDRKELRQRISGFNADKISNLPDVTDLGINWGNFYNPAKIFAVTNKKHITAVIGNGSTPHHQALAATEMGMSVIILRPSWSDIPGEDRWDAAEEMGNVIVVQASKPAGYSYADIMKLVAENPEKALPLIVETSRDSVRNGYSLLAKRWGIPFVPVAAASTPGSNQPAP